LSDRHGGFVVAVSGCRVKQLQQNRQKGLTIGYACYVCLRYDRYGKRKPDKATELQSQAKPIASRLHTDRTDAGWRPARLSARRKGRIRGAGEKTLRDTSTRATEASYPALSLCDLIFSGVVKRHPRQLYIAASRRPDAHPAQRKSRRFCCEEAAGSDQTSSRHAACD